MLQYVCLKHPMKREKSLSRKVDVEEIEDIGELLLKEVDIEAEKKTSKVLPGVKKKDLGNRTLRCAKLRRCSRARRQCCKCSIGDLG